MEALAQEIGVSGHLIVFAFTYRSHGFRRFLVQTMVYVDSGAAGNIIKVIR